MSTLNAPFSFAVLQAAVPVALCLCFGELDIAQHSTAQHSTIRHSTAQPGAAWCSLPETNCKAYHPSLPPPFRIYTSAGRCLTQVLSWALHKCWCSLPETNCKTYQSPPPPPSPLCAYTSAGLVQNEGGTKLEQSS